MALQNDGNLVIYTAAGRAVWSTNTSNDYLAPGAILLPGQSLHEVGSPNEPVSQLVMQGDGNLVSYNGAHAMWSTRTFVPGSFAVMQTDGNFVVYAPGGRAVWSAATQGHAAPCAVVLQPFGGVVVVDAAYNVLRIYG